MAPDGNLFLVTPNDYSLIYKVEHILSRKYRPHFHQFTERDLRDLFHRAGMRIVHLEKFYKSPSGTIARVSKNGFFMHVRKDIDDSHLRIKKRAGYSGPLSSTKLTTNSKHLRQRNGSSVYAG
ncbi:MAG: hypothetical protein IPP40_09435 [bacterium]|nr:hypothetical protein [bacterium]